jgi:hypothetical protein
MWSLLPPPAATRTSSTIKSHLYQATPGVADGGRRTYTCRAQQHRRPCPMAQARHAPRVRQIKSVLQRRGVHNSIALRIPKPQGRTYM